MRCLIHFHLVTGLFRGDSLLRNVVLYWRHCIRVKSCHHSVNQRILNVKLTWVVRGMMNVFHVYCFKSVGSFKQKLSRIESLVILYRGENCNMILSAYIFNRVTGYIFQVMMHCCPCRLMLIHFRKTI